MSSDDTPSAVIEDRNGAGHVPERKCILTGAHGERASLIRLALGPDGAVWPDLAARLPGRGAWIVADRAVLDAAIAKGRLKGALARAFKGPVIGPDDLADRIAAGLERRSLDRLGLEHRAGHLIFGSDKLNEWCRGGRVHLLLHAADAAEDGVSKLNQALRAGRGAERGQRAGEGDMTAVIRLPMGRDALSRALGRENVVHSGVIDGKAAARIATEVARLAAFLGTSGMIGDGRATPGRRNDEGRE